MSGNTAAVSHRWDVHLLLLALLWIGGCGDGGGNTSGKGSGPQQDQGNETASGEDIYRRRCASCHLSDGKGIPGQFPPLVGSQRTIGDPEIPVRIVLHGMMGPLTIDNVRYDGLMPGWHDKLSSQEVATVVSHIRSAWGNGASAVDAGMVEKVKGKYPGRSTPWEARELGK